MATNISKNSAATTNTSKTVASSADRLLIGGSYFLIIGSGYVLALEPAVISSPPVTNLSKS